MNHRVARDPDLDLSAAEFTATWNASAHAASGTAAVDDGPAASFISLEVTVALIAAAAAIPTSVIVNFISEHLKKKFLEEDVPPVTVTTMIARESNPLTDACASRHVLL